MDYVSCRGSVNVHTQRRQSVCRWFFDVVIWPLWRQFGLWNDAVIIDKGDPWWNPKCEAAGWTKTEIKRVCISWWYFTWVCVVTFSQPVNPLDSKGNYSVTSNNTKLVHWPLMSGLLHMVQRRRAGRAAAPPSPLLAVPNVTAHPSTASVPITVLLYDSYSNTVIWWSVVLRF